MTEQIDGAVLATRIEALDRHVTAELAALRRATETANANSDKAIGVAAAEAKERLLAHNGLIDQMERQQGTFATRDALDEFKESNNVRMTRIESFQNKLAGGLLVVSVIGVANLVKIWT